MKTTALIFHGERKLSLEESPSPSPGRGQVRIKSLLSAISAGSEALVYQGSLPEEIFFPEEVTALRGQSRYPLRFGYSLVGEVVDLGPEVEPQWLGRRVFAFHPHQTDFVAPLADLRVLPPDLPPERAVFLPNLESAVNFVQDGQPLLGERVMVLGQGVVGLLTTALLARFPLEQLISVDPVALRREASLQLGAHQSLAPEEFCGKASFDLSYELSGHPGVLNRALQATTFGGRVVIGSWYGKRKAEIDLGGHFHRSRIQILSSQVSTLAPALRGNWDKERRLEWVLQMLEEIQPERLIRHRFPFQEAVSAFQQVDQHPDQCLQVVLEY